MEYQSHLEWNLGDTQFTVKTYDRTHCVKFGGGSNIIASSAPEFLGKAELPNPEELFIASIASCLMLTFLYLAATKGLSLVKYHSRSVGTLTKNSEGKMAMTQVIVKPQLEFAGTQPDKNVLQDLFDKAHAQCFISNSVKTNVQIALD